MEQTRPARHRPPVTEKGKVLELKGNHANVLPDKSAACFGCMNIECKAGGLITAYNSLALPLETGQTVELESPPGSSLFRQAVTAFLPPALGFVAGFALTRLLFPMAGEAAAASMGVVFLFVAAFVVYWIRKKYPVKCEYTVSRIIG